MTTPDPDTCPRCGGTGGENQFHGPDDNYDREDCPECGGTGKAAIPQTGLVAPAAAAVPPGAPLHEPAALAAVAPVARQTTSFAPGIVDRDGDTVYPTGDEWLLAFALKGCQWAVDAVNARRAEAGADAPQVRPGKRVPGTRRLELHVSHGTVAVYGTGEAVPPMLDESEAARRLLAFDGLLEACKRALATDADGLSELSEVVARYETP